MFADFYTNAKKQVNKPNNKPLQSPVASSYRSKSPFQTKRDNNLTSKLNSVTNDSRIATAIEYENTSNTPNTPNTRNTYTKMAKQNKSKSPTPITIEKVSLKRNIMTKNSSASAAILDKNFKTNISSSQKQHFGLYETVDFRNNNKEKSVMMSKSREKRSPAKNNGKAETLYTNKEGNDIEFNEHKHQRFEEFWKDINDMKEKFYERLEEQAKTIGTQSPSNNPFVLKQKLSHHNLMNCTIEDLVNKSFENSKTDLQFNVSNNLGSQESFLITNNRIKSKQNSRSSSPIRLELNNMDDKSIDHMNKSREFSIQMEKIGSSLLLKNKLKSGLFEPQDGNDKLSNVQSPEREFKKKKGIQNNTSFQMNDGYIANPVSNYSTFQRDPEGDISIIPHKQMKYKTNFIDNIDNQKSTDQNISITEIELDLLKYKKEFIRLDSLIKEKDNMINEFRKQLKEKQDDTVKYEKEKENNKYKELNEEFKKERKKLEMMLDQTMNKLQALQQVSLDNGAQIEKLKKENKILEAIPQDKKGIDIKIRELENNLKLQVDLNNDLRDKMNMISIVKDQDISTKEFKLQEIMNNSLEETEALRRENSKLRESINTLMSEKEQNDTSLKEEYKKMTDNLSNVLKQFEAVKLSNKELQESNNFLKRENEQLIEKNKVETNKSQEKIALLNKENEQNQNKIESLNDSLRQTKEINQIISSGKDNKEEKINKIIQDFTIKLQDQVDEKNLLAKKLQVLNKEYDSFKENYVKQKAVANNLPSANTLPSTNTLPSANTNTNEFQEIKLNYSILVAEKDKHMQKIEELKEQINNQKKYFNDNEKLKEQSQTANEDLPVLKSLKNENQSLKNEIEKVNTDNINLTKNLQNLTNENLNLQSENMKLKNDSASLQNESNTAVEEELHQQILNLSTEMMKVRSEKTELENKLKVEQGKSPDKMKNDLKELSTQLDKLKSENKTLTNNVTSLNKTSVDTDKLKSENKTLTNNVTSLNKTIVDNDKKLKSLNDQITKMSSKDKLAAAFEELRKEHEKIKEENRIKIQKLEQKVNDADIYKVQNEGLKSALQDQDIKIKTLTASSNSSNINNEANNTEELAKLKLSIQEMTDDVNSKVGVIEKQKELIKKYQLENKTLQQQVNDHNN